MRSWPRLPMVLTVSLLSLLTVLAVLQYRSTTGLVESQRILQESVLRSSLLGVRSDLWALFEDISVDFGPIDPMEADLSAILGERLSSVSESSGMPDLFDEVYVVTPRSDAFQLERLDPAARLLRPEPWSVEWSEWRKYLETETESLESLPDGSLRLELGSAPSFGKKPGVIIPVLNPGLEQAIPSIRFILVTLQTEIIKSRVLSSLQQKHFLEPDEDYTVVWADSEAGTPATERKSESGGRLMMSVPIQVEGTRVFTAYADGQSVLATDRDEMFVASAVPTEEREVGSRLKLYSNSGSQTEALYTARRRQLGLALGIFVLIGLALVLLYIVARRAQVLGEQQVSFVAGISHELRTPIAAIKALADNMERGIVKDENHAREYGQLLAHEGNRLKLMVEQVLDYATTESKPDYQSDPVNLLELIHQSLQDHSQMLSSASVRVVGEPTAEANTVNGDADALAIVFGNILQNAVKHGPITGTITVTVRQLEERKQPVVQVMITDEGSGFAPDEVTRVFEPFFRGASARNGQTAGNGLGLSLVRRIVTNHGGRVYAENDPAGGGRVIVQLPQKP